MEAHTFFKKGAQKLDKFKKVVIMDIKNFIIVIILLFGGFFGLMYLYEFSEVLFFIISGIVTAIFFIATVFG